MKVQGLDLKDVPTIRDLESLELIGKETGSDVAKLVKMLSVLIDPAEDTRQAKEIETYIYNLPASSIKDLGDYVSGITESSEKK